MTDPFQRIKNKKHFLESKKIDQLKKVHDGIALFSEADTVLKKAEDLLNTAVVIESKRVFSHYFHGLPMYLPQHAEEPPSYVQKTPLRRAVSFPGIP